MHIYIYIYINREREGERLLSVPPQSSRSSCSASDWMRCTRSCAASTWYGGGCFYERGTPVNPKSSTCKQRSCQAVCFDPKGGGAQHLKAPIPTTPGVTRH